MTTTSELRSQLERQSEEISQIAHRLEDRLEAYIDWPGMVRQHPFQSIGVAALAGVVLSGSGGAIMRGIGQQLGTLIQATVTATIMSSVGNLNKPQSI